MSKDLDPPDIASGVPRRPDRLDLPPVADPPSAEGKSTDAASTDFSHYRSGLSQFRTRLSEHRTDLSEFRTDLSRHRTSLSDSRTEMSMRRTGMSLHRTRMSADRTLMSEIRTSLSLITFGFTISEAFKKLVEAGMIQQAQAPRNFGLALVLLGVALLVGGIIRQIQFATQLRHSRAMMKEMGLIHAESTYPVSVTLVIAVALMLLGIVAAGDILLDSAARI